MTSTEVNDKLSLGIALGWDLYNLSQQNSDSVFSLGPSATYYFVEQDRLAAYFNGGWRKGFTDATVLSFFSTTLGAEYFATPSVAFGPGLFFNPDYKTAVQLFFIIAS